ncbi:MAG: ribosome small subunit-dependent GTPase A [Firmicutes bacterium HGW-Firmicutes-1]|jgi:ribosome biogenesis GTPase|nr:MAG: ribosome small subunit-dependent GTPase A [Firmicutes bacterium HGW-Firmicutes-1]
MKQTNLYNLGLSEDISNEANQLDSTLFLARVSVQHKDMYKIITEDREIQAEVSGRLSYHASEIADYPAVGDWVLVDRIDDYGGNAIIHHILSRKSCFERKAAGDKYERQIVAANIDVVFICMSLNNDYNLRRLERYLSIAWDSRAKPVVVLTKADLCNDIESRLREIEEIAIGVNVVVASCLDADGYSHMIKYMEKRKTVAFIGSSGVGKSTLINKLMGQNVLVTNSLRNDDKGRHTTTHRQLILLPQGTIVIDTPGMRELQIAGADLSMSFSDIEEYSNHCYYKDCNHENEPRCAVREAIEEGTLSLERYENYKKLQKEMLFEERKVTMTASQAEKEKIKDMMGSLDACKRLQKFNRKNKRMK